jgi:hypothetical protein
MSELINDGWFNVEIPLSLDPLTGRPMLLCYAMHGEPAALRVAKWPV